MLNKKMLLSGSRRWSKLIYTCGGSYFSVWGAARDGTLTRLGSIAGSQWAESRVDAAGQYAYTVEWAAHKIRKLNVSIPSAIAEIGSYTNATTFDRPYAIWFDEATDHAYVRNSYVDELHVFDVSPSGNPTVTDSLSMGAAGETCLVDPSIGVLFASGWGKVYSVDISNPASLSKIDTDTSTTHYERTAHMALDTVNRILIVTNDLSNSITFLSYTAGGVLTMEKRISSTSKWYYPKGVCCDPVRQVAFINCSHGASPNTHYGVSAVDYSTLASADEVGWLEFGSNVWWSGYHLWYDAEWDVVWRSGYQTNTLGMLDVSDETSMSLIGETSDGTYLGNLEHITAAGVIN